MTRKKNSFDFEKDILELENIVSKMEAGDLTLEASLAHFEKGIGLLRTCQKALQEAEQRVEILVQKNGDLQLVPFVVASNASGRGLE